MTPPFSLADHIRTIPDYPKPGIQFRDITTLLGHAGAFRRAIDELVQPYAGQKIDKIAGIIKQGGLTLIPLSLYFKDGKAKVELALGKGKKAYDKRQDLKEKEANREMTRALSRKNSGKD